MIPSFFAKYCLFGFLSAAVFAACRAIYFGCRKRKMDILHECVLLLFVFCLMGMISQTTFPLIRIEYYDWRTFFQTLKINCHFYTGSLELSKEGISWTASSGAMLRYNLIPLHTLFQFLFGESEIYQGEAWKQNSFMNLAGNIILFLPLGFLAPFVSDRLKKVSNVFLLFSALIVAIEVIQYFTGRSADIDDYILNIFGIMIGFLLSKTPPIRKILSFHRKTAE